MNRPMPLTLDDSIKLNKLSVSLKPVIYDVVDISNNVVPFSASRETCNYYDDCYCQFTCFCHGDTTCECDEMPDCNCDND